ncbi:MAG: PilZ domain-containing protein [Nitrospiraceae bacterium]
MRQSRLRDQADVHAGAKLFRPLTSRKRRFQAHRQATRIAFDCEVYYCGINVQGQGVIRDISSRGCQIEGTVTVKPGIKLSLVLTIPDLYSPTVVDRAVVVWSDGNRFGLQHEVLLPSERNRLQRVLHGSERPLHLPNDTPTPLA